MFMTKKLFFHILKIIIFSKIIIFMFFTSCSKIEDSDANSFEKFGARTDYALEFDGSNDYVNVDNLTGELNSPSGLPFTVQVWAYPETDFSETTTNCTSEREAVFAFNKTGGSDENRNMLYYAPDGSSQKFWHHGTGNNNCTASSNSSEPGKWYHIVMTVDSSGNGKLYVNSEEEATYSTSNSSANKFSIGQEYDGSGTTASDFFDGKIDEVAVWNVALTATDVTTLYNSGKGLKASANLGNYDKSEDLIGYWQFNEGTGSKLTDRTLNSNKGTLINMSSDDWVGSGLSLAEYEYFSHRE